MAHRLPHDRQPSPTKTVERGSESDTLERAAGFSPRGLTTTRRIRWRTMRAPLHA